MYRRIKTRTAQEGRTVRSITLVLYSQWLDDGPRDKDARQTAEKRPRTPPWFGSVKVDPNLPHDMASVRESIALHLGE